MVFTPRQSSSARHAKAVVAFAIVASFSLLASRAAADETRTEELSFHLPTDLAVTGGVWTGALTLELLKPSIAPRACVWCETRLNAVDETVRDALKRTSTEVPDVASTVSGFVLSPLLQLGFLALASNHEDRIANAPQDLIIVAEAAGIATLLNEVTKYSFGRERPFVRALPENEKGTTSTPADNNLSFYSGHTSMAFSLAVASGTVASMRHYKLAPLVWVSGLTLGAATGYLRIAADRHYFTDVMTGAAVGSLTGFLVPYLFHGSSKGRSLPTVMVAPVQGGTMAIANFTL